MKLKEALEHLNYFVELKYKCELNRSYFPYQSTEIMEKLSLKIKQHIESDEFKIEADNE